MNFGSTGGPDGLLDGPRPLPRAGVNLLTGIKFSNQILEFVVALSAASRM